MKKQEEYWHISRRFTPPEGDALKKAQKLAEDDRRGTVREAVTILKNETGEFINIDQAIRNSEILSYAPGSRLRLAVSARHQTFVTDEEEIYADDLNKWLDEKYPRIKFRFQTETAAPAAKGKVPVARQQDDDGDWKIKCPAIAQKLGEIQLKTTGAHQVTARNICQAVQAELAEDSTTHGRQGPRSVHSVRTVGLKGWKFCPPKRVKKVD